MRTSRKSLAVAAAVACCVLLAWFSPSIHGGQKTYEVRPYVIPEYRTDAGRAIDAYERLMERHMNLTEKNLFRVVTDVQNIATKLSLIDTKLTELSLRIGRIEKALGIEQAEQSGLGKPRRESSTEKPSPRGTAVSAEVFSHEAAKSPR